jgi:hypothetical protein
MSIHDLLGVLHEQNGAMLERKTAEVLSAFLAGYAHARSVDGYPSDEKFLNAFNVWVARKLKNEGGQGWAKLVAFNSASELEEWKLFWKLHDEFRERHTRKRPSVAETMV